MGTGRFRSVARQAATTSRARLVTPSKQPAESLQKTSTGSIGIGLAEHQNGLCPPRYRFAYDLAGGHAAEHPASPPNTSCSMAGYEREAPILGRSRRGPCLECLYRALACDRTNMSLCIHRSASWHYYRKRASSGRNRPRRRACLSSGDASPRSETQAFSRSRMSRYSGNVNARPSWHRDAGQDTQARHRPGPRLRGEQIATGSFPSKDVGLTTRGPAMRSG